MAESVLTNTIPGEGLCSLVGDAGADLAMGRKLISDAEAGNSRETVLLGLRENLGMGKELGGGEFE